jgi:hypothetical protein
MYISREAVNLIETYARLQPSRANLAERQSLIVRLVNEHGIWNGYGGEDTHSWFTDLGERIGPLHPNMQVIESLAGDLGVTVTHFDITFDLDKQDHSGFIGGYDKTPAGIASAYRALLLHQVILQKIAEVAGARGNNGEAQIAP